MKGVKRLEKILSSAIFFNLRNILQCSSRFFLSRTVFFMLTGYHLYFYIHWSICTLSYFIETRYQISVKPYLLIQSCLNSKQWFYWTKTMGSKPYNYGPEHVAVRCSSSLKTTFISTLVYAVSDYNLSGTCRCILDICSQMFTFIFWYVLFANASI